MKRGVSFLAAALIYMGGGVARAGDSGDLLVARSWLAAAAGDRAAVEGATAVPFTYRTTNKIHRCEGVVRDASALAKWSSCFAKEQKLLLDEIRTGASLQGPSKHEVASKALQAVAARVRGDGRWLYAYISGDGVTFFFLFQIVGGDGAAKVRAVVLDEEFESG